MPFAINPYSTPMTPDILFISYDMECCRASMTNVRHMTYSHRLLLLRHYIHAQVADVLLENKSLHGQPFSSATWPISLPSLFLGLVGGGGDEENDQENV